MGHSRKIHIVHGGEVTSLGTNDATVWTSSTLQALCSAYRQAACLHNVERFVHDAVLLAEIQSLLVNLRDAHAISTRAMSTRVTF